MTTAEETPKGLTLMLYRTKALGRESTPERELLAGVNQVTLTEIRYADGRVTPVPKSSQVFPAGEDRPAVALVERKIFGNSSTWHIQPVSATGWVMAGGTYAATSDSRFGEITKFYGAVAVHDWKE